MSERNRFNPGFMLLDYEDPDDPYIEDLQSNEHPNNPNKNGENSSNDVQSSISILAP